MQQLDALLTTRNFCVPTKQVDGEWFKDRLAARDMTQVDLAKILGLDKSAVTRMLSGERKASSEEIVKMSDLLDVPIEDVYERLGLPTPRQTESVKVIGSVKDDGIIVKKKGGTVPALPRTPGTVVAVIDDNVASFFYGYAWYYDEAQTNVPVEAIGKLCVVRQSDNSPLALRVIRNGAKAGLFDLVSLGGNVSRNVAVKSAAPVLGSRAS